VNIPVVNGVNQTAGSVRQLASGKWQSTVRLGEGRGAARVTKTFATRKAAMAHLSATRATGMASGEMAQQTVAQAFDVYIASKVLKPNTVQTYVTAKGHVVTSGLGAVRLKALKPSAVVAFTTWKLTAVLKFAAADGALSFAPKTSSVTEYHEEIPVITAADVAKLYEAAPDGFAPMILLGAFCGLRASEACAITVGDIDFLAGMLSVTKASDEVGAMVTTKTARSVRKVPIAADVLVHLGAVAKGKPMTDTLATNAFGQPVAPRTLFTTFSKIATEAGVPITFHSLRKFYATNLLSAGVNPKAVAKYLGDSVQTMLKTYALVAATDADQAKAAMSKAFADVAAA